MIFWQRSQLLRLRPTRGERLCGRVGLAVNPLFIHFYRRIGEFRVVVQTA